jgi:hypothetical protein
MAWYSTVYGAWNVMPSFLPLFLTVRHRSYACSDAVTIGFSTSTFSPASNAALACG